MINSLVAASVAFNSNVGRLTAYIIVESCRAVVRATNPLNTVLSTLDKDVTWLPTDRNFSCKRYIVLTELVRTAIAFSASSVISGVFGQT